MSEKREATSMSVRQMGMLLGLGKTDSYWLIKKNLFKVITVKGRMRIMRDSFEEWYQSQSHYKKVAPEEARAWPERRKNGIHR